jgi:hypothetical protein
MILLDDFLPICFLVPLGVPLAYFYLVLLCVPCTVLKHVAKTPNLHIFYNFNNILNI